MREEGIQGNILQNSLLGVVDRGESNPIFYENSLDSASNFSPCCVRREYEIVVCHFVLPVQILGVVLVR